MNLLTTVLVVFVVLVILYYIINWLTTKSVKLINLEDASKQKTVSANKLKENKSSNFTYSIWFYVEEWDIGRTKPLLSVINKNGDNSIDVTLGNNENNIKIGILCQPSDVGDDNMATCTVRNFPLQKWVNLIFSVYGRTLDVYLDGKLTQTQVLPNVARMRGLESVNVGGGFKGKIADLRHWADASNPQQAYNIYSSGFGQGASNIFNKYKIRISFLEDGKSEGHFDI